MENNDNRHDDIKVDSFKLYESAKDGLDKEVNGKKYLNDFELYPEDID